MYNDYNNKKIDQGDLEEQQKCEGKADEGNYMIYGMCLGMALGISIGHLIFDNMTTGMTVGMCLGLAVGAVIKKR